MKGTHTRRVHARTHTYTYTHVRTVHTQNTTNARTHTHTHTHITRKCLVANMEQAVQRARVRYTAERNMSEVILQVSKNRMAAILTSLWKLSKFHYPLANFPTFLPLKLHLSEF